MQATREYVPGAEDLTASSRERPVTHVIGRSRK